jgi:hypothetical protein
MFRKLVCCIMLGIFPAAMMAADSTAAMMYVKGAAWVNGSAVSRSSAVFAGDLVQTKPDSVAKINASGSSVSVGADSLVKFEANDVSLDHGAVGIATSKSMAAHTGALSVTPATGAWTSYKLKNTGGKVLIMAHKGDLTINDASGTTTLSEGRQTTRYASYDSKGGAAPAAGGGILDSPIAIGIGVAAVAGLVTWVLVQGSEPASKSTP